MCALSLFDPLSVAILAPIRESNRLSETTPPPPTGGGAKYGLIGILLILLAIGVYCGTQPDDPEPVADPIVETPTRPTQFEPEIEIPDEEEDAGPPDTGFDAGEEEVAMSTMMSTMRRVPRNCEGNLEVAAVRQVVARQRPQVRACYERALKQNNILQGTVNVRLTIGSTGSVDRVNVGCLLYTSPSPRD